MKIVGVSINFAMRKCCWSDLGVMAYTLSCSANNIPPKYLRITIVNFKKSKQEKEEGYLLCALELHSISPSITKRKNS